MYKVHILFSLPITYGVPQGSVLSPTLFSVLMNDIPTPSQTSNSVFADDLAYYLLAPSFTEGYAKMTVVLQELKQWTKESGMTINTTKS